MSLPFKKKKKQAYRASRGDAFAHVTHVLNRRLQRTGKPFDLYGLYRAVTIRGGFGSRPLARRHLNMMQVFREMKNHYDKHTYTDIGTQLLNTYESYFLDYERDHPQDLNVAACPQCGRAPPRRPPETGCPGVAKEPKEATSAREETAAKDERPGAFKREDGVTKQEAPAKPPASAVSSACAISPFGGVAWAREGVADADLRAAAEGSPSEPLNGSAKEPSARSALLPLGWVECDACRVLTHVACARDGAADVTPGNQVAWFVCDACDAKARGVVSASESGLAAGLADRVPKLTPARPTRGKSPLSSRSRASSRARPREGEGTKRDRDGREVRPSLEPTTLEPFSPRRGFSDAGDYDGRVRPNTRIAFAPGSPYGTHAGAHAGVAHAGVAPSYAYHEWHGAGDDAYRAADAPAAWALQRERESAAAAAAAAAMEMEMERSAAHATYPNAAIQMGQIRFRGFPMAAAAAPAAPERLPSSPPNAQRVQNGFQNGSPRVSRAEKDFPEKEFSPHARRALGSLPGARLRRSNSAQNILNAALTDQRGDVRGGNGNGASSPAPDASDRGVVALTRSASQCSLGAEHFWRGLLDANPLQDDAENEAGGGEGADLFAFA